MKLKIKHLCLVTLTGLFAQPLFANNPEAPGLFRSLTYSSTAGEVFWTRSTDDVAVVLYEIRRNDEVIATIDGLSYFESSLTASSHYRYDIVAIDNDGNRSAVATTTLSTLSENGSNPTTMPSEETSITLAAPENLNASVYSGSAVELFWDKNASDTYSFSVYQNQMPVATTDGASFFTDALSPSTEYQFEVVAKDSDGATSPAAMVTVTTRGAAGDSVVQPTGTISGLSVTAYSQTAAELFWDRPVVSVNAAVFRNGILIGASEGDSFFDNSRQSGQEYEYTINIQSASGSTVATGTVSDTGFDTDTEMTGTGTDTDTDTDTDTGTDTDTDTDTDTGTDTGTANSTTGVVCDYVDMTYNDSASVLDTSTSEWSCSETERVLTANGLPDHATGEFPNGGNPNTISTQEVTAAYTLTPTETDTATTLGGPAGAQGYVLNGVKIDAATAGTCDDSGDACSAVGNTGNWSIEALGHSSFNFGTDENNAHVQPGGAYHYHGMPEGFITKQGGNSSNITLIAWAADGFPIYARYGYSVANDASSAITGMTGSYQLKSEVAANRPSTDTYTLGTFAQDWEYVAGSGDLDECNGRVGVTPEFPGGIYHYYATDTYPYFQRCVKGEVEGGAGPGGGNPPPR